MANLKLSQLPAANALSGDEIVPLVQGGQTRRATAGIIADLRKGAWQVPALNAPWTNYGDAFANAAYRKDGNRVQLRGLVKGGSGSSIVFLLPVGFRPLAQHLFVINTDIAVAVRIDVRSNGEVYLPQATSAPLGWMSLDSVSFYVD